MSLPEITPEQLKAEAAEHYLVPLATKEDVARDGLRIWVEGEGSRLISVDGKSYVDMMSAMTRANSLGYGNHEIARAVYDQLATLHYAGSRNNIAEPTIRLSDKVAALAPGDLSRVIFTSGGSEAVESALKLAKHYHVAAGRKPNAKKVISRWNAYHGATMGALSVTDWLGMRHIMEPGVPGGSFIPGPMNYRNPFGMEEDAYNDFCADALERQILREGPEYVAAFIAEPVMQANGVQIAPARYLQRVREICDRYDVLWIDDEVITGFGRTGNWFAIERAGVVPDMMTFAKALTAGYLPGGGMIARPHIYDAIPAYRHLNTFMGHPGVAACALKVIEIMEREQLVEKARVDGAYFLDALKQELEPLPIVGQVRGIGMWLAVDFTSDKATKAAFTDDTVQAVVRKMWDNGIIASAIGTAFELAPPYNVSRSDLDLTVKVAREAIVAVAQERGLF